MSESFEPELGQMIFGNSHDFLLAMEYHVEAGLHALGAVLAPHSGGYDLTANWATANLKG